MNQDNLDGRLARHQKFVRRYRRGAASASVDYFLLLGVIMPLALIMVRYVPRIIELVYELAVTIISSPTM